MTAMINDSTTRTGEAAPETPIVFAPANDQTVLAVARRMHDRKCRQGTGCGFRDWHALQGYETTIKDVLSAMVDAQAAAEI